MSRKIFSVLLIILFISISPIVNGQQNGGFVVAQNKEPIYGRSTGETEDSASILVDEIAKHLHKLPNKRVTVADFTDIEGNDLEEGKLFAEQVITRMLRHGGFRVIERSRLNKVLEEKSSTWPELPKRKKKRSVLY